MRLDKTLFEWLNGSDSVAIDTFFFCYTSLLSWLPIAALIIYFIVRNSLRENGSYRQALCLILLFALLITCADQVSSSVLKPLVARLRPTHDPAMEHIVDIVNGYRGGKYSFPSSHAANSFAVMFFTIPLFRSRIYSICIAVWAILFCYSRIYLGVHYPSDIIAGMILGAMLALVFVRIAKYCTHGLSLSGADKQLFVCLYAATHLVLIGVSVFSHYLCIL